MTGDGGSQAGQGRRESAPWWHEAPDRPPGDSVLAEGVKLAAALRDWAVESGAAAAVAEVAQTAANGATTYLAASVQQSARTPAEAPMPVVRCADCPVCQGLDALDRTNPQAASAVRSALGQVSALVAGLLGGSESPDQQAND